MSEDHTGPLSRSQVGAVAFDTQQITSKANRTRVEEGLPASTLAARSKMMVAFSAKDHGADATEGPVANATGMPHDGSHANGGGQIAVAFSMITANTGSNGLGISKEVAPTLDQAQPAAVAFDAYNQTASDVSHPLRVGLGNGCGDEIQQTVQNMQVRRLTPRECERLQGFPDDYTLIPYRGKPAADGPRYKALGNSMAVPVMAWIGKRMQMVEDIE